MTISRILVTGAGGFIGHHLVKRLKAEGHWVRGVDQKLAEYEPSDADEFEVLDLRMYESCLAATRGKIDDVYNLAADMGGIGYITAYLADISRNNILINAHMLEASKQNAVKRFLFPPPLASMHRTSRRARTSPRCARRMLTPQSPSQDMDGRNCSLRNCAATTVTIMDSRPAQCVSTMSTARLARTTAGRKKLQPPFPVR